MVSFQMAVWASLSQFFIGLKLYPNRCIRQPFKWAVLPRLRFNHQFSNKQVNYPETHPRH